jgi:hypothetical protein
VCKHVYYIVLALILCSETQLLRLSVTYVLVGVLHVISLAWYTNDTHCATSEAQPSAYRHYDRAHLFVLSASM